MINRGSSAAIIQTIFLDLFIQLFINFCSLQPHTDTRAKQIAAWKSLILEYYRVTKQAIVDVREVHSSPLFNNVAINRILYKIKI